jgi:hypothetical protein
MCAGAHGNRCERVEVGRGPQRARNGHESEEDDGQQYDGGKHRGLRRYRVQQGKREETDRQAENGEFLPVQLHAIAPLGPSAKNRTDRVLRLYATVQAAFSARTVSPILFSYASRLLPYLRGPGRVR